jgi:DNA-binding winged helix-turn-helix (wHTH) protein
VIDAPTSTARRAQHESTILWIGAFRFDPSSRELATADATKRLSPKAAAVLSMLAEAQGLVCSRDEILDCVWPNVTVSEEVLTHAVAELRRAFGDTRAAPHHIETIHKKGYRLKVQARADDPEHAGTHGQLDLAAYGLCLEANDCFNKGGAQNTKRAVELFSLAATRNPRYARAHAGLAKALIFSSLYYQPDDESLACAEAHCATALEADPRSAEALVTTGLLKEIKHGLHAASWDFARSLASAPDCRETHFIVGRSCFLRGDYRPAIGILERAAALWGEDLYSLMLAGKLRLKMGDETGAAANFIRGAKRSESALRSNSGSYRAVQSQANFLWHLGRKGEALALLDELQSHGDPMPYYTASFLALIGEHEEAVKLLSRVVDCGFRHAAFFEHDPDFDTLRADKRFVRIARSIGAAV